MKVLAVMPCKVLTPFHLTSFGSLESVVLNNVERGTENCLVMPDRSPATRGAPKGSVPKSRLFSIFIRYLDGDTVRFVDDLSCLHWQTAKLPCRSSFIHLRSEPTDTSWCSTRKHDLFQAGKHLAEEPSWLKGVGDYRGHKAKCVNLESIQ